MKFDMTLRSKYQFRTAVGCCFGVLLLVTLSWPSGDGSVLAQTGSNHLTGCLTPGGTLTKLALGDAPAHPCSRQETQITLNVGEIPQATSGAFYVVLDRDTERTIAMNGTHKFVCRCNDIDMNLVAIHIEATSTASEWLATGPASSGSYGPFSTNQSVILISGGFNSGELIQEGEVTIIDDNSYLTISNLRLGNRLFGRYCIVSGTVSSALRTP